METTHSQERALEAVRALQAARPNGGGIGVISGVAGTGKSTLIRLLDEEWGDVVALAPTGKAALRVREVAGTESYTIHAWNYAATEDSETGDVTYALKAASSIKRPECGFLVVDEASMVTAELFRDLVIRSRELGLNLIFVGDGAQLPPVEKNPGQEGFSIFNPSMPANFRVELTEIHRQALDSPIIQASIQVRTGGDVYDALDSLGAVSYNDMPAEGAEISEMGGFVICYTNKARQALNKHIRASINRPSHQIEKGEPLLVLKNNYRLEVYNGEIIEVMSSPETVFRDPIAVRDRKADLSAYTNYLEFQYARERTCVVSDTQVFGDLGQLNPWVVEREFKSRKKRNDFVHANFGYVVSCHKAQGSEAKSGIVCIEPKMQLETKFGRQWLYVALTRFKSSVKICWLP